MRDACAALLRNLPWNSGEIIFSVIQPRPRECRPCDRVGKRPGLGSRVEKGRKSLPIKGPSTHRLDRWPFAALECKGVVVTPAATRWQPRRNAGETITTGCRKEPCPRTRQGCHRWRHQGLKWKLRDTRPRRWSGKSLRIFPGTVSPVVSPLRLAGVA